MTIHAQQRGLIVEDDPAWQEILAELLTDMGLAVDIADSLDAAIAALRAASHRLAVVDLSLTGGSRQAGNYTAYDEEGLRVLEAVRRYDPGCSAVLLTGFATVELAVSALTERGAYTCLRKETFRRAEFRELARRILALAPPAPLPEAAPGAPAHETPAQAVGLAASQGSVLLVEDDAGWRNMLAELLAEAGCQPRASGSFGEALGYLRRERFVLAVVDLGLASSLDPGTNRDGYQVLASARAAEIPAIVVSGLASPADVERAYADFGIFAYLEKQAFDRSAFRAIVSDAIASGQADAGELGRLTPREREGVGLLVQGLANKEIARAMVISTNTVKRYLKSIFHKLDVDSRAAAVAKAVAAKTSCGWNPAR